MGVIFWFHLKLIKMKLNKLKGQNGIKGIFKASISKEGLSVLKYEK